MYGLPHDFDPAALVGHRFEQVCFSENQVWLHFDAGLKIGIESSFSYRRRSSPMNIPSVKIPVLESDVMHLLGERIARASGNEAGTLSLVFESGDELHVFDDSDQYESYRLVLGTREIIV
jgi:hypothetical protein